MMDLRTGLFATRRGLRFGRRAVRMLSLLAVSIVGLTALGASTEPPLEDEADRNGRVVFRHFL